MIVADVQCACKQVVHVHAFANNLAGCRRLAFVNEVATTKRFRGQTNHASDFIHLPFQREDALRRAETSEGAVRRNVSGDSATVNPHVRTNVWPGGMYGSA